MVVRSKPKIIQFIKFEFRPSDFDGTTSYRSKVGKIECIGYSMVDIFQSLAL